MSNSPTESFARACSVPASPRTPRTSRSKSIEASTRVSSRRKLVQKMKAALNEVWPIPDVRVFFSEYEAANVAQDGVFEAEQVRPICFLYVPLLRSLDAKRKLTRTLHAAFAEAYERIANTKEFMIFYNL